jgi:peptide/nickel transport system ATP-binding protein
MTPVLSVKNLSISFGDSKAVSGLSFTLESGKTLAIVGESGSGKSVSSLAIMGLLPKQAKISADQMRFVETDLLTADATTHRKLRGREMTMIFQEPMTSLNPAMKCGKQVVEALQCCKAYSTASARSKTLDWFEKVKLPDPMSVFEKYPHQLSGGQRQRVMIAMAMCTQPKLLIADEPTTALDVTVQKSVLNLLRELQAEMGMAMIFITHDLGVVKEVADDVLVMYRGEMQEFGSVDQIINHPQAAYTQGLLACRPPIDHKPHRLPTVEDYLQPHTPSERLDKVEDSRFKAQGSKLGHEGQGSESILTIQDLHKFFPQAKKSWFGRREKLEVLKGISLEVFKGESLGLVGESGCGKSTLGRNIIRLLQPEEGTLIFKGIDITHLKGNALRKLRKEIQIIFQDPYSSLNPRQRIGDAIVEPMAIHGLHTSKKQRVKKAKELLEKVGLKAEQFNRYPHEFSGGQRQRIGIARALAVEPELIVCDESVSALDVSVQAQVLNLLNDLKDEFGLTYLFISHDLSVVNYFCDRIAVMNKGEIVELDLSEKVFFHPQNAYTQSLIAAIPGR